MRLLAAALFLLQGPAARAELRAGLDTLYAGDFAAAAAYFDRLARRDSTDPAPLIFHAGAYIWWASAQDSSQFQERLIDSLLDAAIHRARLLGESGGEGGEFWLGTALGYRARQRVIHGHPFGAAKDGKAMHDAYGRVLAADSACIDCYLGIGVYEYGLARASTLARLFAKLIGLGSGDADRGLQYLRRVSRDGDLARVEATWVLAAALQREAARDATKRAELDREARSGVEGLAARYPGNPVFRRFLSEIAPARTSPPPPP